jgi:DNA invertase Pin-like site-specific DNA recombinase
VRQPSVQQVRQHQESAELRYRLVDRAVGLGWPRERVHVIDEDLGRSSATSGERHGFQPLIAEIGLGNAGLVLSLDASRLARNNRDWHQLLELGSLFSVILADGERLDDPSAYHDRLLLGLSGIMSEAELHQIKLCGCTRASARRRPAASCACRCRPGSAGGAAATSPSTPTRRCRSGCGWSSPSSPSCGAPAP